MATSLEDLTAGARTFLRDFPQYFEVDTGVLNVLTIRLPHPLVSPQSLQVYLNTQALPGPPPVAANTALTADWSLDERAGLLKLTNPADLGKSVVVAGYHYTWFTDSDLEFHVKKSLNEVAYNNDMSSFTPVHYDVMMLGGVVHALWSLAMELSLDIDVSTPEGMFIPARQRFTQVLQMLQYWEGEYSEKASMLNIGLGALEVFQLRRVAYMTGRYVPVYQTREFDDPDPPVRLYPPIPDGTMGPAAELEVEVIETLYPPSLL